MRGQFQRALEIGPALLSGDVCHLEWITQDDVRVAWQVFSTFHDKEWSFTDCLSRVVIERLGIVTAVAFDEHFLQFGTVAVVP